MCLHPTPPHLRIVLVETGLPRSVSTQFSLRKSQPGTVNVPGSIMT